MEEKYNELVDKIKQKIENIEEKIYMLDMVDKWDDKTKLAYDLRTQELNDLNDILKLTETTKSDELVNLFNMLREFDYARNGKEASIKFLEYVIDCFKSY